MSHFDYKYCVIVYVIYICRLIFIHYRGPSWSWSYGSWIYNTIYAIGAYHHWCCEFESRSGRGVQHNVIKFVSDLRQVGGFSAGTPVSSTNKTDRHDIAEILLKVALNTIKQTTKNHYRVCLSTHAPGVCGNHTHHGGCPTGYTWLVQWFYGWCALFS